MFSVCTHYIVSVIITCWWHSTLHYQTLITRQTLWVCLDLTVFIMSFHERFYIIYLNEPIGNSAEQFLSAIALYPRPTPPPPFCIIIKNEIEALHIPATATKLFHSLCIFSTFHTSEQWELVKSYTMRLHKSNAHCFCFCMVKRVSLTNWGVASAKFNLFPTFTLKAFNW